MADGRRERNSSGAQVQTTRQGETESGIITIALFLSSRSLARSAPLILINRRQQDDRQRRRQRRLRERGKKHALSVNAVAAAPSFPSFMHTHTHSRAEISTQPGGETTVRHSVFFFSLHLSKPFIIGSRGSQTCAKGDGGGDDAKHCVGGLRGLLHHFIMRPSFLPSFLPSSAPLTTTTTAAPLRRNL